MRLLKRSKLAIDLLLSLYLLTPAFSAFAKKNQDPIIIHTVPDFDNFVLYENSEELPNGFIKVDVGYRFFWLDEESNMLGYAEQYITGIQRIPDKADGMVSLHGYGVFTSTITEKPGTITYTIGNNWLPATNEYFAGRLSIKGGTGYFEGIKGPGELNFETFAFELYVNFDPWE
ncbi:MAG: hypothetical protein JSV27_01490 [Candidatus Bathyarchaeota archaeon]|nr:MAG: hypothetical protein JSV27_01490 [Candidatus Bathyarchaeota archaeon]